jgi:chromosomal replication initiation ATPase DnaA
VPAGGTLYKMNEYRLINDIANGSGCTSSDVLGYMRTQHIADARAVAQYMLRGYGWTWQRIADLFKCHHSAVIHNYKKVENDEKLIITANKLITL